MNVFAVLASIVIVIMFLLAILLAVSGLVRLWLDGSTIGEEKDVPWVDHDGNLCR